jgi:FMN phosphatase YigB (HAD superfamily)
MTSSNKQQDVLCLPQLQQLALPFCDRVLFVDWHGVLSRDTFWSRVHGRSRQTQVALARAAIWSPSTLGKDWMQGILSTHDIVNRTTLVFTGNYAPDYAVRAVYEDVRSMPLCDTLVRALRIAARFVPVVIASDNIDLFSSAVASREDVRSFAYGCLCSADVGTLKAQDPNLFFRPALRHLGLDFARSILVDDSEANCRMFKRAGGSAYRVNDGNHAASVVLSLMSPMARP